jgi:hypothetical protein
MYDSPGDILRAELERVSHELAKTTSSAGKKAVAVFLAENPTFNDYLELVSHALTALTTYNELALGNATGPDPDAFLADRAGQAAEALKEMRVSFDHVVEQYRFMLE